MAIRKLLVCAGLAALNALALDIVSGGKSDFSIYLPANAQLSILTGARELQDYCRKVTGVKLPIVDRPKSPMICLGDNASLRAAGFRASDVKLEGYEVKVKGGNVYVFGQDTPEGKHCAGGGRSDGTQNGVYALLEECFGVRWLMPGKFGDYYKPLSTVTVPDAGFGSVPHFLNRRVPYIHEEQAVVREWGARQKLGYSLYLNHAHNWIQTCTLADFKSHPEWFAISGGKPSRPVDYASKLCPTNPSTIRRFCEAIDEYFTKNPERTCFSLSPSDGGGWCECERCKGMYEKDPDGHLSVTPAILYFYNEVAKVIHPKYPDKILAGYIYADYLYPPKTPMPLEDGLFLTLAPSFDYGHTLYRQDIRDRFELVMREWPKSTTNISFYDLPQTLHNTLGMTSPVGLEILKYMYPRIAGAKMKGVYVYGTHAWGHAGVSNYIIARLAWNPYLDVEAEFESYCSMAYAEAAPEMMAIYRLYDEQTKAYFNAHHQESYTASEGRMKTVYAKTLPEVVGLFLAGEKKVKDSKAKERMRYFKANLQIMEWSFTAMGILDGKHPTPLMVSDDEVNAILADKTLEFAICKEGSRKGELKTVVKAASDAVGPAAKKQFKPVVRGQQSLVLKAKEDGIVTLTMKAVRLYGRMIRLEVFDAAMKPLDSKIMRMNAPISLNVKAGEIFRLLLCAGSQDFYVLDITNASWGYIDELGHSGVHMMGEPVVAAFHVPKDTKSFEVMLRGGGGTETAKATLTSPRGRKVVFNCTTSIEDMKTIKVMDGESGFWSMDIDKGDTGVLDDFFLHLGPEIPPVICLDHKNAIKVTEFEIRK